MQDRLLIISLLLAAGIGASLACHGSGMLGGAFGVFVGCFVGYSLIIAFSHIVYYILPRLGIGHDSRTEEVEQ
jgi:hypothetical protein